MRGGTQGSPLVNNKIVFKIYDVKHFIKKFKKKSLHQALKNTVYIHLSSQMPGGPAPCSPRRRYRYRS